MAKVGVQSSQAEGAWAPTLLPRSTLAPEGHVDLVSLSVATPSSLLTA